MKKYVKKPIEVEAIQITAENIAKLRDFLATYCDKDDCSIELSFRGITVTIETLEGDMKAHEGDYIIKGIKGELYPCRKDIFEETYEEVKA